MMNSKNCLASLSLFLVCATALSASPAAPAKETKWPKWVKTVLRDVAGFCGGMAATGNIWAAGGLGAGASADDMDKEGLNVSNPVISTDANNPVDAVGQFHNNIVIDCFGKWRRPMKYPIDWRGDAGRVLLTAMRDRGHNPAGISRDQLARVIAGARKTDSAPVASVRSLVTKGLPPSCEAGFERVLMAMESPKGFESISRAIMAETSRVAKDRTLSGNARQRYLAVLAICRYSAALWAPKPTSGRG